MSWLATCLPVGGRVRRGITGLTVGQSPCQILQRAFTSRSFNTFGSIGLGRRAVRIIRFNIGFSLGIKAVFLLLALAGYSSLWMAIAADTGATLLVVMNSLRLLRGA